MKVEIRLSQRCDEAALCRLFERCFGDAPQDTQRYLAERNAQDRTWVLCEEGAPAAMVTAMPLTVGQRQGVYIYAVGTDPQHRGKGYMHTLCSAVFDALAAQGVAFCLLTPADPKLEQTYRRMGFCDFAPIYRASVAAGQALPMRSLDEEAFLQRHRQHLQSKGDAAWWPEETLRYLFREMCRYGGGAVEYQSDGQSFYAAYTRAGDTVYLLEDSGSQPCVTAAALATRARLPFAQARASQPMAGMQRTPSVLWRALKPLSAPRQGYLAFLLDI